MTLRLSVGPLTRPSAFGAANRQLVGEPLRGRTSLILYPHSRFHIHILILVSSFVFSHFSHSHTLILILVFPLSFVFPFPFSRTHSPIFSF
ncbi:hypothetical protein DL96DRAFT_1638214, partial [Flagelloscypha sp. PMI_526]